MRALIGQKPMFYQSVKQKKRVVLFFAPAARGFYISVVFLNARRVLSQCNTQLRLLYLLNKDQHNT